MDLRIGKLNGSRKAKNWELLVQDPVVLIVFMCLLKVTMGHKKLNTTLRRPRRNVGPETSPQCGCVMILNDPLSCGSWSVFK